MDTFNNQPNVPSVNTQRSLAAFILAWIFLVVGVFGIIKSITDFLIIGSGKEATTPVGMVGVGDKLNFFDSTTNLILAFAMLFVAYGLFKMRKWALLVLTALAVIQIMYFIYLFMNYKMGNPVLIIFEIILIIYFWMHKEKFN